MHNLMLTQNLATNYTSQILLEFEVHNVGKVKTKTYKKHQNERSHNISHEVC
jgi:hypothetical protein